MYFFPSSWIPSFVCPSTFLQEFKVEKAIKGHATMTTISFIDGAPNNLSLLQSINKTLCSNFLFLNYSHQHHNVLNHSDSKANVNLLWHNNKFQNLHYNINTKMKQLKGKTNYQQACILTLLVLASIIT